MSVGLQFGVAVIIVEGMVTGRKYKMLPMFYFVIWVLFGVRENIAICIVIMCAFFLMFLILQYKGKTKKVNLNFAAL